MGNINFLKELEERFVECAACGLIFQSEWSEEDAQEEKKRLWGDVPEEECERVCDDCFKIFMANFN